jgi:hypothetical protein
MVLNIISIFGPSVKQTIKKDKKYNSSLSAKK